MLICVLSCCSMPVGTTATIKTNLDFYNVRYKIDGACIGTNRDMIILIGI